MRNPKLLFTPGPLTTSDRVKQAMLRDLGSRDAEFIAVVRADPPPPAGARRTPAGAYEAVLMQGSGTFAIESVISSRHSARRQAAGADQRRVRPADGQDRARARDRRGLVDVAEDEPVEAAAGGRRWHADGVHYACGRGALRDYDGNREPDRGDRRGGGAKAGARIIVDAMSSFGGIPVERGGGAHRFSDLVGQQVHQGVPGFGFVLARRDRLLEAEGPCAQR